MSKINNLFLLMAKEVAERSEGRYKVGCVITTKNNIVISTSCNSYNKTHPEQKRLAQKTSNPNRQYLHAEVAAIIKAKKSGLKPYKIFISRILKDGSTAISKPCEVCELAIKLAGIKKIFHT